MSSSAKLLGLLVLIATFAIGFLIGKASTSWGGTSGRALVWRILRPTLVVSGLFLVAIQVIPIVLDRFDTKDSGHTRPTPLSADHAIDDDRLGSPAVGDPGRR
jgi:hypothetical protein